MSRSYLAGAPREADQGAQNTHLLRYLALRRSTYATQYASAPQDSAALHLGIFEQPKG